MSIIKQFGTIIMLWCIDLNIFFLKKIYPNRLITLDCISFGDSWRFYIDKRKKILKSKKKIVIITPNDEKVVKFFYEKKSYVKILIPVPLHWSWRIGLGLKNFKNFKSIALKHRKIDEYGFSNVQKKMIVDQIKKAISKKIIEMKSKRYITLFIKHYHTNPNDLYGSCRRQTTNLKKIYKLIQYLIHQNLIIVIMGNHLDKSVKIIKKFAEKNKIENSVLFFNKMSNNYSLEDQIFINQNSLGYVGNASGGMEIPLKLKKKTLIFDCAYFDEIKKIYNTSKYKNIKILYKLIKIEKNKPIILRDSEFNEAKITNYKVIENNFNEIKLHVQKLFNF